MNERFYIYRSLSLYNRFLETFHINNQKILFFNLWSKEVIVNISYPSTFNKMYRYLDASISPTSVRCIISRYKGIYNKNNTINISEGGDILRLLIKNWSKIA